MLDEVITKRIIDIFLALLLLVAVGWVIVVALVLSSIATRSFGLFTQQRIGKHEQEFTIYKIKTMRDILGVNTNTTIRNDPRVTFIGGILTKTKIDELPQLFNVLNGTMSFIGPRPTVLEDVNRMNLAQKRRYSVKPGVSGLAQISGNTELPWPRRIELDLFYIDNFSLMLDFKIFIKTLALVLTINAETHPASSDEWEER